MSDLSINDLSINYLSLNDLSINDLSKNFFLNTKSNFIKEDYKRLRKNNAIQLPPEIKQEMIPKYVVYYKECYNKEKKLYRDFFKIEKHPLIINKKIYVSSKSNKVTIIEKLDQIKKILYNIENNEIINTKEFILDLSDNSKTKIDEIDETTIKLPKYISIKKHEKDNHKYYLLYDKKYTNNRETLRIIYKNKTSLKNNILNFINKINTKYNSNIIYE
jgi:hypothetical protein